MGFFVILLSYGNVWRTSFKTIRHYFIVLLSWETMINLCPNLCNTFTKPFWQNTSSEQLISKKCEPRLIDGAIEGGKQHNVKILFVTLSHWLFRRYKSYVNVCDLLFVFHGGCLKNLYLGISFCISWCFLRTASWFCLRPGCWSSGPARSQPRSRTLAIGQLDAHTIL